MISTEIKIGSTSIILDDIPKYMVDHRREEIENIVLKRQWEFETDELKKELKTQIIELLKTDIRKLKLEKINKI